MKESPVPASPRSALLRRAGFWLGPGAALAVLLGMELDPATPDDERMAAVAVLMATWWVSEAIPLAATALVPLVLFPVMGLMKGSEVAPLYVNSVIFLFLGGFLIALAMERWRLHRRIALAVVAAIGSDPPRLVLGFMLATAALSMWISNTATAIMMLAIGLAVIRQAEESFGAERTRNLAVALLLGIAYAASIGGFATLVGTPPNLALARIFEISFPGASEAGAGLSFGRWMLMALPVSAVLLIVAWAVLVRLCFPSPRELRLPPDLIREERRRLGPMGFEEKAVFAIFATTALLWTFREPISLGSLSLPGWSSLLPFADRLDDGTVAVAMALLLFLIPSRRRGRREGETVEAGEGIQEGSPEHSTLLDACVFAKVPWGIILLFGGGFALAKGFQVSGLSDWVGARFAGLGETPAPALVGAVCALLTFLTEFTSNAATVETVLPLLASVAKAAGIHPLVLMVPAAISASCAFMMPVATPPNAIVFASGRLRIADMVKAGLILNLVGIVVVGGLFLLLGPPALGFDPESLPDWAR